MMGEIIGGSNVESAQLRPHSLCRARCGVDAISQGKRKIKKIAVVADTEELTPPCGVCRQIIWEFGGDIPSSSPTSTARFETVQMKDLLPRAFDTKFLK